MTDGDGDGVADLNDNCPDTANANQADFDYDGIDGVQPGTPGGPSSPGPYGGDACEDSDGDGLMDNQDNCQGTSNAGQQNSDGDSRGDACDNCPTVSNEGFANSDNDSFGNLCDNCASITNANQANQDGDAQGDVCDNCPSVSNSDQSNVDGDELGDACEVPNCVTITNHWTVPNSGDTDCDGYADMDTFGARASETTIGTMAATKCSASATSNNEPLPDAWPPDFNDNQLVNGADILNYNSSFGKHTTDPPVVILGQSIPITRFDLNGSGLVNGADVLQLNPFFGKRCNP
jgi:hypothetical protein